MDIINKLIEIKKLKIETDNQVVWLALDKEWNRLLEAFLDMMGSKRIQQLMDAFGDKTMDGLKLSLWQSIDKVEVKNDK